MPPEGKIRTKGTVMSIVSGVTRGSDPDARKDGGSHFVSDETYEKEGNIGVIKKWHTNPNRVQPRTTVPDNRRADRTAHKLERLRDVSDKDIVLIMGHRAARFSLQECTPAARRAAGARLSRPQAGNRNRRRKGRRPHPVDPVCRLNAYAAVPPFRSGSTSRHTASAALTPVPLRAVEIVQCRERDLEISKRPRQHRAL